MGLKLKGFKFAGIHAGIKKSGKKDLALIVSETNAVLAGVTTKSRVFAAPVKYCRELIADGKAKGVLVNSGNANAFTGEQGYQNCKEIAASLSAKIGGGNVAYTSTGIIGVQLPKDTILAGLNELVDSLQSDPKIFASAIMTTDTREKFMEKELNLSCGNVSILGMAKGSGMIAPNMATMLGFICSDIEISKNDLQKILSDVVDDTYNMVSVDTDTSTNDKVLALANGASGISYADLNEEDKKILFDGFYEVNEYLAKEIAFDGEGATKLIEVNVDKVDTKENARLIAKAIIDSPLVKTAIYGADPNWGRIAMAIGKTTISTIDQDKLSISFAGVPLVSTGIVLDFDRDFLVSKLKQKNVEISVSINSGNESARAWGCDLTEGYIEINTDYN